MHTLPDELSGRLSLICRRPCWDRRPHESLDGLAVTGVGIRVWDEMDALLPDEPGVWGASPPARELGVLGMLRGLAAFARPATSLVLPGVQMWASPWPTSDTGETEVWFVRVGESVYVTFPYT